MWVEIVAGSLPVTFESYGVTIKRNGSCKFRIEKDNVLVLYK